MAESGTMEDFHWLWKFGPGFTVSGDNVTVLHEPSQFYEQLKKLTASASKRIVLASLYLGNGKLEKDLVSELHAAAKRNVEIRVLLDYTRGSRGEINSRTLLTPLLQEFGAPTSSTSDHGDHGEHAESLSQVQVALYHSPRLRGLIRWLLPARWNETVGLSHLKVYLFDDTLILSGANLSDQYFRNRQDRYVVFRDCPHLSDYFSPSTYILSKTAIRNLCRLQTGGSPNSSSPNRETPLQPSPRGGSTDTWVFPLLQMAPLGITQDQEVTERLLAHAPARSTLRLATGYFNLTERYSNIILNNQSSRFDLLVASPKVNGFYGAEGISGVIPTVYTLLLRQFFQRVGPSHAHVRVGEYERPQWTFHGKGLWLWRDGHPWPCLSLIGSPNFGFRSVYQDLEAQVAIVTTNEKLQRQLGHEQQRLYDLAAPVSLATFQNPSRHVPFWSKKRRWTSPVTPSPQRSPPKTVLTLEILQIIKDAQQKHGLRHGDYQRYRGYCSRRLRRLRKSLHFLQGNKHRYQGREVTDELLGGGDARYLLMIVVQCERAWAHAMQLRQEANTEPRKRFHLFGRLRKAVKHAQALEMLCTASTRCDARCKLEAQAYCAYLEGTLHTELQQWKEAMESFSKAQTIYEKLAQALGEVPRALYQQRVDELSPSLRYCAYNIGDETAISDLKRMRLQGNVTMGTELDHLIEQAREKQASSLSEVTWLGRTVPVRHEKVRLFLLAAQEAPRELAQAPDIEAKIAVHERLLFDCKDALQLLREELRAEGGGGQPGKGPGVRTAAAALVPVVSAPSAPRSSATCCSFNSWSRTSQAPRSPRTLYGRTRSLSSAWARCCSFRAWKKERTLRSRFRRSCCSTRRTGCATSGRRWLQAGRYPEAMALYRRGRDYVQQALAVSSHLSKEAVASLKELDGILEGQVYSVHAQSILGSEAEAPTPEDNREIQLLVDRLDTYLEDKSLTTSKPNIAAFPPPFEPIPCKPLFFDLALNHIEFPSLDDVK
ncbi:hypothetical protein MTO96_048062 [Rhipicephalus appendiculatus]